MERERLGSRLGFILLSAGCAIGVGNVWKFPYMTGQYGGGAFVLVYLLCLILLGVPVMTMEFALGRASQKSPVKLYDSLAKKGSKWHLHGYAAMAGNYILMFFYTIVTGWMVRYFVDMATGKFVGASVEEVGNMFGQMMSQPVALIVYMAIVVFVGILVCSLGVQKGVEKISKPMMIALLAIMVILAFNSVFLPGAAEGVKFYLIPDFKRMAEIGIGEVVVGAMNQSFFTLSLGIGSMAIFGSYLGKERSLMGEAVNVAILDTFVALCAGMIIFPACFAYGVQPDSGPNLIFVTLPNIFNNIPMGRLWGSLFFVFMTFAAFSTIIAVFENIIAMCMDLFGWDRKKACLINAIVLFVCSIPCALGFNVWSGFAIAGKGIMDLEDFAVSNILLPLGALTYVLFCVTRYGWGWDKFIAEANEERTELNLAILYIDLDNFKYYNDTFGHDVGDLVLKETAAILNHSAGEMGFAIRYGGDEFIIVLINSNKEESMAIARMTLDEILSKNGYVSEISSFLGRQVIIKREHMISCSIGVATSTDVNSYDKLAELIQHADTSLYSVKHTTKNAVKFYE